MIEPLLWEKDQFGGQLPFENPTGENLKITFHTESFTNLSVEENFALSMLRGLSNLEEIIAYDTQEGDYPNLNMKYVDKKLHSVKVNYFGGSQTAFISNTVDLPVSIMASLGLNDPNDPQVNTIINEMDFLLAHKALNQDIFITKSKIILEYRNIERLSQSNPRSILEAVKIVGLFLRLRKNYVFHIGKNESASCDKSLFYWVLTRNNLPNMWKYFSACVYSEKTRSDNIVYLGQSILKRCEMAIKGRDKIGKHFYQPQNNLTRDEMNYHFNYILVLLVGAIDAQARVAHRTYKLKSPKEHNSDFRKDNFLSALLSNGATDLVNFLRGDNFIALARILYLLRNTVHGAILPTTGYGTAGLGSSKSDEKSFIRIPREYQERLLENIEILGSLNDWGIINEYQTMFLETYTFSTKLIKETFKIINSIAKLTDTDRLFQDVNEIPEGHNKPPSEDGIWNDGIKKNINILGW